jgi:hypothetical protein
LTFTGLAGGLYGQVQRVEARVDSGKWARIQGTNHWRAEVDTSDLSPGIHRIEIRSFDGTYSNVSHSYFTALPKDIDETTPSPSGGVLAFVIALIIIIVIGGIVVIKRINGQIFCVHRSPEGPTFCVPIGTNKAEAGGVSDSEGPEDEITMSQAIIRCFLCLGEIKRPEDLRKCPKCKRRYHTSCARRIGSCPLCGRNLVGDDL